MYRTKEITLPNISEKSIVLTVAGHNLRDIKS